MAERIALYHRKVLRSLLLLSLLIPALVSRTAHGQNAEETARQRIRIRAYGMFSYVNPDFLADSRNKGITVGGDFDGVRLLPRTDLGLDFRYGVSTGLVETQYYFGGGPRLSLDLGRFKPYGDFLFGHGRANFKTPADPNYTHDETPAITFGGGLDYQLTRSWALRADVQHERWRFSVNQPIFYPLSASVGVSYLIHFPSRTGPGL